MMPGPATSKLDALRAVTTVVADTGDAAAIEAFRPTDCTTNPSLILKAADLPAYAPLVDAAAREAASGAAEGALLRLSVAIGARLAALVPGRVSTEADAELSFDAAATAAQGRAIVAAYEALGVDRSRVLVKVAATWEGIAAARALQREGIDCNVTLVFGVAQALAAAEAGAFLISPFVGRVLDWHLARGGGPYAPDEDPGVLSVRAIHAALKGRGFATVIMGASFRSAAQVEALAGLDRLTIAPALLGALAADEGALPRRLAAGAPPLPATAPLTEAAFRWAVNEDAMTSDKLAEGVRHFAADWRKLRALLAARAGVGGGE